MKLLLRVLAIGMGLMSFTACYGVPYTPYTYGGQVTDAEDGHPIPGIRVQACEPVDGGTPPYSPKEETVTDNEGRFVFDYDREPFISALKFDDIDEGENGLYEGRVVNNVAAGKDISVKLNKIKL